VAPSSPGVTANDTTTTRHASTNVAVEDTIVVAISILLLGQDFLKQVQTVNALMQSPLLKSCLIWFFGWDWICSIAI
jgi:hypothetical protein